MPAERRPPHDLDAERALIGACVLVPEIHADLAQAVRPDDFYKEAHGLVWEALQALAAEKVVADTLSLRGRLEAAGKLQRIGGDDGLIEIVDGGALPTLANAEHYARRIRELAAVRATIAAALRVAAEGYEPIEDVTGFLDRAERAVSEAASERAVDKEPVSIGRAAEMSLERLVARQSGKLSDGAPLSTGLRTLDRILRGGNWPGRLVIIAGRPGMGKSALAQQQAMAAGRRAPALFFSLEMPADELGDRAIATDAQVDSNRMAESRINSGEWSRITAAATRLHNANVWVDDKPGVSVAYIRRVARRFKRKRGLSLVVVDYLQLMRPVKVSDSREQDVAEISRSLKELAKELAVPVIALSQLNRKCADRVDKRPQMSDLRESGAIEQDADVIVFVYRDEVYNEQTKAPGIAELIVAKQRGGSVGMVPTSFRKEVTAFYDLEEWRGEPQ
jgi:replicative DNA helicase